MTPADAAWLAGLLEGEGYFGWEKTPGRFGAPVIALAMTDEDVVRRAAALMKAVSVWRGKVYRSHHKQSWHCKVSCSKAIELMELILPFMGSRRSEKITQCINNWKVRPGHKGGSAENLAKYRAKLRRGAGGRYASA